MKIAIGCDHTAVTLKNEVIRHLKEQGHDVIDFGTYDEERTHYPIYAEKVGRAVVSGECQRGILICGTGAGMAIAANKIDGIRAVVCSDTYTAELCRQHNDANVLAFGTLVVGRGLAFKLVDGFLKSDYDGGRHQQRVEMIARLEKGEHLS